MSRTPLARKCVSTNDPVLRSAKDDNPLVVKGSIAHPASLSNAVDGDDEEVAQPVMIKIAVSNRAVISVRMIKSPVLVPGPDRVKVESVLPWYLQEHFVHA